MSVVGAGVESDMSERVELVESVRGVVTGAEPEGEVGISRVG